MIWFGDTDTNNLCNLQHLQSYLWHPYWSSTLLILHLFVLFVRILMTLLMNLAPSQAGSWPSIPHFLWTNERTCLFAKYYCWELGRWMQTTKTETCHVQCSHLPTFTHSISLYSGSSLSSNSRLVHSIQLAQKPK